MRFNEKELAVIAQKDGDLVGRLQYTQYKGPPGSYKTNGFRDRFFKLVGNLLFYFRFNEMGTVDYKEPVGVIVLENYSVQPEYDVDLSFAFGILFLDEPDRRHIFTARTDKDVQLWINTLQTASYQHWSHQLTLKRTQLHALLESRQSSIAAPRELFPLQSTSHPMYEIKNDTPLISFEDSNSNFIPTIPPRFQLQHSLPPPIPPRPNARKREEDLIKF
ncbi:unnamed protein product [Allacma fusca]|uniref:PH domain-containing protein n=1 Tax=Allacma fusca TaxID=39272 RepID=A0A8J2Q391_9HEXA|nr:unnamed protein product [Allacma fusca]